MPRRDKELTEPLVQWLADEMKRQGVDEADLSRRASMQQAQLWKILRRKVAPEVATLKRLAQALGHQLPSLIVAPLPNEKPAPPRLRKPPTLPQDDRSGPEGRTIRSPEGYLLRELMGRDMTLRALVEEGGAEYAEVGRIAAHQAGQMLADRVAAIFRHTFEVNEIANTAAGRTFTVAFLKKVVWDFSSLGLNVSDMARYILELERSDDPPEALAPPT